LPAAKQQIPRATTPRCGMTIRGGVSNRITIVVRETISTRTAPPYNKSSMPEQPRPADSRPRHEKTPAPAPPRTLPVLSVWLRDLFISLAISAFIIIFLYQPVKVEGTSMMPSLDDQERIFVNKYVYRLEPIQRGDIVVFRYPRDTSKSFIKRVIGLAGDRIRIESGEVFVNGEALEEDYVPAAYADQRSSSELVVPANSYFVLGDHRTMSNDSRDFGPVSIGYIYGKAVFGYWPMDKMGRVR
jgi:signal peptidase I